MMTLIRMAGRLLLLPGQLLIRVVDRPHGKHGMGPLSRFTRGCVHVFLGILVLIAFSIATHPPATATATAAPTIAVQRPTVAPTRPAPRSPAPPTSAPASTRPSTPVEDGPVFVPAPDNDDDGESWFCRRRRWC